MGSGCAELCAGWEMVHVVEARLNVGVQCRLEAGEPRGVILPSRAGMPPSAWPGVLRCVCGTRWGNQSWELGVGAGWSLPADWVG